MEPLLSDADFESRDDFWDYMDEVTRFNNYLPPGKVSRAVFDPIVAAPSAGSGGRRRRIAERQVGLRLTPPVYEKLTRLAKMHSVATATMARILVTRGVEAAFPDEEGGSS